MLQKIALVFRLYRHSLLFLSILLTSVFIFIMYDNQGAESIELRQFIYARVIIFAPVLYLFYEFKKKEFIYYRNLGISRLRLLTYIEIIDIVVSTIILAVSYAIIK